MNELQTLENLLAELLREVERVVASGEILSDEFQGELALTLDRLVNRIEELRGEAVITPPTPPLENAPFASAQVHSFKYDPDSQQLFVKFQGDYPQENGPVYMYENVPKFIYDIFQRGAVGPKTSGRNAWHAWKKDTLPSLGAALNALIKAGGYPYTRLT